MNYMEMLKKSVLKKIFISRGSGFLFNIGYAWIGIKIATRRSDLDSGADLDPNSE